MKHLLLYICFCGVIFPKLLFADFKWQHVYGPGSINYPNSPQNLVAYFDINSQGIIFTATNEEKVYRSTDDGIHWENLSSYPYTRATPLCIGRNDFIYTADIGRGFICSVDNGLSWFIKNDTIWGKIGLLQDKWDKAIEINSKDMIFVLTSNGVYRSEDYGQSWTRCYAPITNAITITSNDFIYILSDYSFSEHQLMCSKDDGNTWIQVCKIKKDAHPLLESFGNNLFLALNFIVDGGLYYSTDEGKTFNKIWDGNNQLITSLSFSEYNDIFMCVSGSSKGGVYRSTDTGLSWVSINDGLVPHFDNFYYPQSSIITKKGYVLVGDVGTGIYRSCLPINQSEYTHIEAEGPNPNCDDIPVLLKATPEGDSYHYLWSTGETTPQILADTTGTYILEVTYDFGCTSKDTIFVKVEPKFEAGITGDSILCNGEVITLTGEPFNPSYKFLWSTGETQPLIKVNKPGLITLIVTNPAGCADTVTKEIKDGLMGFAIKGSLEFCEGQSSKLTAPLTGNAFKYLWSTGETTESITVGSSGTYWLKIEDNLGCKGYDTVLVNVFPRITASILPNVNPVQFCEGDTIKLTAQPFESGMTYLWSTGEATPEIYVSKEGEYLVKVKSINGCTDSAKINVIMNPKPDVKIIGNTVICENETTEFSAAQDYSSYLWSTGETTKTITIDKKGTYWLKVTNEFGCSDSTSITINTIQSPKAEIDIQASTPLCEGETAILSSILDFDKYLWSTGEQNKSIQVQKTGYYSLKVLNEFGCSDTVGTFLSFQPNIHFWLDTVNASIGNDKVSLSLKGKYDNEIPLTIKQMSLKIKFDKTCFFPKENQMFTIIENNTIGDNRFFNFQLENVELNKASTLLAKIEGLTLLGNKQVNEISIEEVIIPESSFCVDKKPGILILDSVCVFNLRKITFFNPDILSLTPNPANIELEIELLRSDKIQSISVYSMTGRNELSVTNLNESKTKLDISNLPVGKYILEIQTSKGKLTESFVILR